MDRDSPAGIEYQLPIERARERTMGDAVPSGGKSRLFGAGVSTAARPDRKDDAQATATAPVEKPAPRTSTAETVRAQADAPGGGGGGLATVAATGAAVLLIGALAGLGWRRRTARR